ncbi:MAG TPA: hypothetical protein ENL27_00865, partial [Candidatus Parcubacteria bacterium]|nr:hypothetical protein [Candidatus Parcubacteria bacterium]
MFKLIYNIKKYKYEQESMKRKTKTFLLLTLLVLFIVTSFLAIAYSLGWRFDWKTKKITQPGMFYFKVWPQKADIYINGKYEKKTDFFFGSALIDNILPGEYKIEIKKQGFYPWRKTLKIEKR